MHKKCKRLLEELTRRTSNNTSFTIRAGYDSRSLPSPLSMLSKHHASQPHQCSSPPAETIHRNPRRDSQSASKEIVEASRVAALAVAEMVARTETTEMEMEIEFWEATVRAAARSNWILLPENAHATRWQRILDMRAHPRKVCAPTTGNRGFEELKLRISPTEFLGMQVEFLGEQVTVH